jgi:flavorubredoxin
VKYPGEPVTRLKDVLPCMEDFHKRYMNGNKVCRFGVNMVRGLDIDMIVPQHGRAFAGVAIEQFIQWIEQLPCGVDLMTQDDYRIP